MTLCAKGLLREALFAFPAALSLPPVALETRPPAGILGSSCNRREIEVRIPALALLCLLTFPAGLPAKVLLDSSEKTFARECLDGEAPVEDLIQICQQALEQGGYGQVQKIDLMTMLGDARRWVGDYEAAEATYHETLALDPRSTGALNGLGWVAYDRDDYATAAGFFRRSIDISPSNDGLGGYAESAYYSDQIGAEEALGYLDAALALDRDRWTLRSKGWILRDQRRYEEAVAPFEAALGIDDEDVNALIGLARTLSDLDREAEALPHINRAAELEPDNLTALIWRSHISRWNGNNLRALKDAELVMQRAPERSDGVVLKARALSRMGLDYLALTTLREVEARFVGNAFFTYWLSEMLMRDAQYDEVMERMSGNLGDSDVDGYDYRLYAEAALELGRLSEARGAVEAGREMAPWMDRLKFLECRLLVMEGDLDAAEAAFAAAVEGGMSSGYAGDLAKEMIKRGEMQRAVAFRNRY